MQVFIFSAPVIHKSTLSYVFIRFAITKIGNQMYQLICYSHCDKQNYYITTRKCCKYSTHLIYKISLSRQTLYNKTISGIKGSSLSEYWLCCTTKTVLNVHLLPIAWRWYTWIQNYGSSMCHLRICPVSLLIASMISFQQDCISVDSLNQS